jgi:putative oxidoreductase
MFPLREHPSLAGSLQFVGPLALIGFIAAMLWLTYGPSMTWLVFRPWQNVEFFQNLAIIGGLLMYFACGPGVWSRTRLR